MKNTFLSGVTFGILAIGFFSNGTIFGGSDGVEAEDEFDVEENCNLGIGKDTGTATGVGPGHNIIFVCVGLCGFLTIFSGGCFDCLCFFDFPIPSLLNFL